MNARLLFPAALRNSELKEARYVYHFISLMPSLSTLPLSLKLMGKRRAKRIQEMVEGEEQICKE